MSGFFAFALAFELGCPWIRLDGLVPALLDLGLPGSCTVLFGFRPLALSCVHVMACGCSGVSCYSVAAVDVRIKLHCVRKLQWTFGFSAQDSCCPTLALVAAVLPCARTALRFFLRLHRLWFCLPTPAVDVSCCFCSRTGLLGLAACTGSDVSLPCVCCTGFHLVCIGIAVGLLLSRLSCCPSTCTGYWASFRLHWIPARCVCPSSVADLHRIPAGLLNSCIGCLGAL